jgi:hypothetical protein
VKGCSIKNLSDRPLTYAAVEGPTEVWQLNIKPGETVSFVGGLIPRCHMQGVMFYVATHEESPLDR